MFPLNTREALGPDWQAQDLGEFLEARENRDGKRRRLFYLVFVVLAWTPGLCAIRWLLRRPSLDGLLTRLSNS